MTKHISDTEFETAITKGSGYSLIDFWAEWCGPCRQLGPVIDELSKEMSGKVAIYKMDIDANPDTPTKLGVRGIPTLMLFKDGKHIATKVGSLPKSSLIEWIESEMND